MPENAEWEKGQLGLLRIDLAKALKGFSSDAPTIDIYELSGSRLPRDDFPVPEM